MISGRRVRYGPIDPLVSRQLLIQHGLVEGDLEQAPEFLVHNRQLLKDVELLQAKLRRHDLVLGEWARYDFYDRRVPADVFDVPRLSHWLRRAEHKNPQLLFMSPADLMREPVDMDEEDYPERIVVQEMDLPLEYEFNPGAEDDGITLTVPLEALNQIDPARVGWLVPGLLAQKIEALIRSLPKDLRRPLVPAPDTAKKVLQAIRFGEGDMLEAVARILSRIAGQVIPPHAFQEEAAGDSADERARVGRGRAAPVAKPGRRRTARELGAEAARSVSSLEDPQWTRRLTRPGTWTSCPWKWRFAGAAGDEGLPDAGRLPRGGGSARRPTRRNRRPIRAISACGGCSISPDAGRWDQAQWMPNYDKMLLFTNRIRGLNLRSQLAELIADRAFMANRPLALKAGFHEQLAAGQQQIGWAVKRWSRGDPPV